MCFGLDWKVPGSSRGSQRTDSRFRPDTRCLERGHLAEATAAKLLMEAKHRATKRSRQADGRSSDGPNHGWTPAWFQQVSPDQTKRACDDTAACSALGRWVFAGMYWECREKGIWGAVATCPDYDLWSDHAGVTWEA
jgi:hypothetical protein